MSGAGWKTTLRRLPFYLVVALIVVYALTPFIWALSTSFKTEDDLFGAARLFPRDPTTKNYVYVLMLRRKG